MDILKSGKWMCKPRHGQVLAGPVDLRCLLLQQEETAT